VSIATPAAAAATGGAGLVQTGLSLLVVLAAIFALAWVLRRVQGFRTGASGVLQIQAGVQVGPRERVVWLRAGEAHLLIGVAPGSVRTLHVFAESPAIVPAEAAAPNPTFAEALRKVLQGEGRK
jgi:flagellar protein FliO/FliZ